MSLVVIEYKEVSNRFSKEFLDQVTSINYPLGKNTERSWIIKSEGNIAQNGNKEIDFYNQMCLEARMMGYNGVIITKNPL